MGQVYISESLNSGRWPRPQGKRGSGGVLGVA